MKKLIFIFTIFFSFITYSATETEIQEQLIKDSVNILRFNSSKNVSDFYASDLYTADKAIEVFSTKKEKITKQIMFIFPNVKELRENIDNVLKRTDELFIVVLKEKSEEKRLENRDLVSYNEMKFPNNKKIKLIVIDNKYDNVLLDFYANGFTFSSGLFKKDIYNQYKNLANINYLKGVVVNE